MPQIITALPTAGGADFQRLTTDRCRKITAIAADPANDHYRAA
jgi:hypothetical protein